MLPQGSIFQYGFLDGVQYKEIPQKVDFLSKKWGFIQKYPKNWIFHITWGFIQEWGCNIADTVIFFGQLPCFSPNKIRVISTP